MICFFLFENFCFSLLRKAVKTLKDIKQYD